ncbi:MAG: hypothetical protein QOI35_3960 [Cryptosporangiaceae bacterium]|jgi:hypothetical protein|nr:hypothetical protein [Cryptosporangiaceae bacterium]
MPLSTEVRTAVKTLLEPGEELRYLFPASVPTSANLLVAVTDRAIVLINTGLWSRDQPKSVHARYRRDLRLGPVDVSLIPVVRIGGLLLEVDDEYVAVVHAADAELAGGAGLPPDPLPGV